MSTCSLSYGTHVCVKGNAYFTELRSLGPLHLMRMKPPLFIYITERDFTQNRTLDSWLPYLTNGFSFPQFYERRIGKASIETETSIRWPLPSRKRRILNPLTSNPK